METKYERRRRLKRENYLKHRHPCIDCGILIGKKATRCHNCANKFGWTSGKKKPNPNFRREKCPNWKGGINYERGYVLILKPEHPKANKKGYVREHILIWEQANKKPLPPGWIIHHLNGVKGDNRPVNLQALPNKKHYLVLQAKAKRIQELEGLLNHQHPLL